MTIRVNTQKQTQGSLIGHLWAFLAAAHPAVQEIGARRQAQLLAVMTLFLTITNGLGSLASLATLAQRGTALIMLGLTLATLCGYILSRTPYFKVGSWLSVIAFVLTGALNVIVAQGDLSGAFLTTIPISYLIAIGLFTTGEVGILTGLWFVGFLLAVFLGPEVLASKSGSVGGQILSLTLVSLIVVTARNAIERGRVEEVRRVNRQLEALSANLEQRVAERTQDLALAAEVGRLVLLVHEQQTMLRKAVELIRQRFDLYYTQVYLVDVSGKNLVLQAGTGSVGDQLVQRGHQLPLDVSSLNGTAAVERRAVIVTDTAKSASFLPNPLLPETRSEMSVPLIAGERLLGVLDLQSERPGALSEENLPVFETLAGQLAAAIQNAELFERAERARRELEANTRRMTRQGWENYLDGIKSRERIAYSYDQQVVVPVEQALPEIDEENALVQPIEVAGEPVGRLQFEREEGWTRDDVELVETVARQAAQQMENLRLLAQAERYRHEAERAVRRLTRQGWEEYLEGMKEAKLGFMYADGLVMPIEQDGGAASADLAGDQVQYLTCDIQVRNETVGQFGIAGVEALSSEELEIVSTISEQLSAHLENLRLYNTAQLELEERRRAEAAMAKRAAELETVATLSTSVSAVNDPTQIMQQVVDLVKQSFGLYHAHIYRLDETEGLLILAAGAGEVGRLMVAEGWQIPLNNDHSLVARAARSRQGVIANDVRSNPEFLPNPRLPDTRSEMAVPLVSGKRVIGVLDVQSERLNQFTQEDLNIQTTLASQIAAALENASLFQQIQRKAAFEAMVNEISQKIQNTTTVEKALQVAIRELGHALGAKRTSVQLYAGTSDREPQDLATMLPQTRSN